MRTHFDRKRECPGLVNSDIKLTDHVKQHVLLNHIYNVKTGKTVGEKIKCLEKESY